MKAKDKISKTDLTRLALLAVRNKKGCEKTERVEIERHDEPDALGRTWHITQIDPPIVNSDASYRAFHAAADLQDKFDLAD